MNFKWEDRKDLDGILAHREKLIAQSARDREAIAHGAKGLEKPITYVVQGYRAVSFVRQNPVLVGLGTAVFSRFLSDNVFALFGRKRKHKKKRGVWGNLKFWGSRIATTATFAQQLMRYWAKSRRPAPAPAPGSK